jgi:hypothetical protein
MQVVVLADRVLVQLGAVVVMEALMQLLIQAAVVQVVVTLATAATAVQE